MTRVAALLAVGGALVVAVLIWAGTSGRHDDAYLVRASFDSASGLRTGMEVRTSGVKIGAVRSVTLDQSDPALPRAVAVLDITTPRMRDFRVNATCTVRAASLLGDRLVDCTPRAPGKPAPALRTATYDGERQHVLPVTRTSSPVDPDLVLDIFRLPVRQRLSIIINELGAGLAGNGGALRQAVRRADPSLLQLNRVLTIVSGQRRALASLADSSQKVLEPLAREREHLVGVAGHGAELNEAVARRGPALRATFRRLPAFLTQLRSTLRDIDGLSATSGPVFADLDASARQFSTASEQLAPLARAGTPALRALGRAASDQQRGLLAAQPVLGELQQVVPAAQPVTANLSGLLKSLNDQGAIDRLATLPRTLSLTSNGFDRYGYYARGNLLITTCLYQATPLSACTGTFFKDSSGATAAKASAASAPAARASRAGASGSGSGNKAALLDYLLGESR